MIKNYMIRTVSFLKSNILIINIGFESKNLPNDSHGGDEIYFGTIYHLGKLTIINTYWTFMKELEI